MSRQTTPIAGIVSVEINEAVESYARQHGITKSRALHILLGKAVAIDPPELRQRGRPKSLPCND